MAFRTTVTFLLLSIAISAGQGSVIQTLSGIFLKPVESIVNLGNDTFLNFTELSGQHGFVTEEHTVTTEDGYIITIFRMKDPNCVELKKTPVLLMPGLFQSADAALDAGPNAGMAYLIAAECHDLWVGNQRGNYYGRRHVSLNPDKDAKFWQFSTDEMGIYDNPAIVDYILKNTGNEKLNYVGFAQSVATSMIMCSERPGYCEKLNVFIALGPITRITNFKSLPLRAIFEGSNTLKGVLALAGFNEVFARGAAVQTLIGLLCKYDASAGAICGTGVTVADLSYPGSIDDETLRLLATHTPAGTSLITLLRYQQSLHSDKFQKYNYGETKNIEIYGSKQSPSYNLGAVTAPVAVVYGLDDKVSVVEDVLWMVDQLPNVLEATPVSEPRFNHFDMFYSQYINTLVFPKVKQYLEYNT